MRRSAALLLVVLALGAAAFLWWPRGEQATTETGQAVTRAEAAPEATPKALEGAKPSLEAGPAAKRPRTAEEPFEDPLSHEFFGVVLDAQEKPVAGADVRFATGRPAVDLQQTTDGQGRFTFAVQLPGDRRMEWGVFTARHGTRVGHASTWLRKDDGRGGLPDTKRTSVGPIRLAEATTLDVQVTSACPGGLPAKVFVSWPNLPDAPLLAEASTDASGRARFEGLASGQRRVVAAAAGCGRVEALVTLPRADGTPLALELPASRSVTVTVVEKGTGSPVPGAEVEVKIEVRVAEVMYRVSPVPLPGIAVTGADGRATIAGLGPQDALWLRATAPGFPSPASDGDNPGTARLKAGESEARIELARPRTIAWPVKAGTAPVPADGTEIRLTPWTNSGVTNVPASGRMEGGRLVVAGWGPGWASGYAHAPGGGIARLQAQPDQDVGPETAFHVTRSIEVVVTLEGEGPAVGWIATAYDQGNNAVDRGVPTDASGTARLVDLYGGPGSLVDVRLQPPQSASFRGFSAGTVDLAQRDGRIEVTVPREREVLVAVSVEGRPGLPPGPGSLTIQDTWIKDAARDEVAGELRFRWRPTPGSAQAHVQLTQQGFLTATAPLDVPPGGQALRVALDLVRAATLLVRVELPKDGRHAVVAQRFDETKGAWPTDLESNTQMSMISAERGKAGADGIARLSPLRPGRYRVYDPHSGVVSQDVQVAAGDPPAEVRLDLSATGWVRGRVLVPEGESLAGAAVGRADSQARQAPDMFGRGTPGLVGVGRDGTFSFRVAGDRPLRLRVFHPTLRADPREGFVDVSGPRDGVELRLVAGPTAVLRFEKPVMAFMNPGSKRPLVVRLFDGEPVGEPRATASAMLEGDGLSATFGGFDPGTWTVWIDTPPFVPTVLKRVVLKDGANDLGTATLATGSRYVLEVQVKEGQDPPRYAIWITAEGDAGYVRSGELFSGKQGIVTGLAHGRYTVHVHPYAGTKTLPPETIEFDGTIDVRRTIDLR